MQIADGEPEANLQRAIRLVEASPASDLILLPELFTTGYAHETWGETAAKHTPAALERLSQSASNKRTALAGSVVSTNQDGKLVNRLWLLLPDGRRPHYDKQHLFAPMREQELLCAGTTPLIENLIEFRATFSICFDLRFPEMYREAAIAGANLMCVVSEWPTPRAEALRILAKARAVENHAYVALCNRVGVAKDGTEFSGGSAIISPDGSILADAADQADAIISAEIDSATCAKLRDAVGTFDCYSEPLRARA
jgi:predicted amidohydrolase